MSRPLDADTREALARLEQAGAKSLLINSPEGEAMITELAVDMEFGSPQEAIISTIQETLNTLYALDAQTPDHPESVLLGVVEFMIGIAIAAGKSAQYEGLLDA